MRDKTPNNYSYAYGVYNVESDRILQCHINGMNITEISKMFNVSRPTVYSVLKGVQGGEPTAEKE